MSNGLLLIVDVYELKTIIMELSLETPKLSHENAKYI